MQAGVYCPRGPILGYMCMPVADLKSHSVWVGRGYSLPSAWGQCTVVVIYTLHPSVVF